MTFCTIILESNETLYEPGLTSSATVQETTASALESTTTNMLSSSKLYYSTFNLFYKGEAKDTKIISKHTSLKTDKTMRCLYILSTYQIALSYQ